MSHDYQWVFFTNCVFEMPNSKLFGYYKTQTLGVWNEYYKWKQTNIMHSWMMLPIYLENNSVKKSWHINILKKLKNKPFYLDLQNTN